MEHLVQASVHRAGNQLVRNGRISVAGRQFFYDVHRSDNGLLSFSTEVLPHRKIPYRLRLNGAKRIGKNAVLIAHSGFCFAKYPQAEAQVEDHIFYLGRQIRGVELIVFGHSKSQLLKRSITLIEQLRYVWEKL